MTYSTSSNKSKIYAYSSKSLTDWNQVSESLLNVKKIKGAFDLLKRHDKHNNIE